jgi:hypothetical protein
MYAAPPVYSAETTPYHVPIVARKAKLSAPSNFWSNYSADFVTKHEGREEAGLNQEGKL